MQAYILGVCGAVIISALVTVLLPAGKLGKFINGILKIFCVLVMLVPLFTLLTDWKDGDFGSSDNGEDVTVELDDELLDYAFSLRAEKEEDDWKKYIEAEFGVVVSVHILWTYAEYAYNVTELQIKIENFGIYGEDEHIFVIEQVKNRISELTSAEVAVYE